MPTYATPGPINVRIDLPFGDTSIIASDRDTTVVDVLGEEREVTRACAPATSSRSRPQPRRRPRLLGWGLGMLGLGAGTGATVTVEVPAGSGLHATTRHGSLSAEGRLDACRVSTDYGDVHLDEAGSSRSAPGTATSRSNTPPRTRRSPPARATSGSAWSRAPRPSPTTTATSPWPRRWARCSCAARTATCRSSGCSRTSWRATPTAASGSTSSSRAACDVATTYGEVEIGIAEGTAAWLDIRSDTGNVHNRLDEQPGPDAFDRTAEIHARTRDGNIVIRRARRPAEARPRFWRKR